MTLPQSAGISRRMATLTTDDRTRGGQGPVLRWSIRILILLLMALLGRAVTSEPRVQAQIEIGVALLKERMAQSAPAEEASQEPAAPVVRAMPQNRTPVHRAAPTK